MELEILFYRVLGPDNFVRGQGEGNFRDVNETDNTCKLGLLCLCRPGTVNN